MYTAAVAEIELEKGAVGEALSEREEWSVGRGKETDASAQDCQGMNAHVNHLGT